MEQQQNFLSSIGDLIAQEESFQRIMADGMVTGEELQEQSERVSELLNEVERRFSADDLDIVRRLFVETNVLSAVYQFYELQNLKLYGNL